MYNKEYISSAVTTEVSTGKCVLHSIVVGETAAGTITVTDGDTTVAVLKTSVGEGTYEFDMIINESLTVTTENTTLVEDCEDAWDELVDVDVTSTLETTIVKVGAGSAKLAVGDLVAAGDILATEAIAATDISNTDSIRFWIRSSVATAAGDLQLLLSESAEGATPAESLDVPALAVDEWTEVTVDLTATTADLDAIISVGIKCVVDIGAHDLYIDDIQAVGTASKITVMWKPTA
jgi:hypothetical protein